jgi:hypothetical protein
VRKKFGQWVRLNLTPSQPIPESPEPVENPAPDTPQVQPQTPPEPTQVQPLLNPALSSSEEISNNQTLSPEAPEAGVDQSHPLPEPTWTAIQPDDLRNGTRSEALRQDAVERGHLKNTPADHLNFFTAIAHALRVAKHNACGLLRTVVEQRLWHFLSQADEYNALQRLRRATNEREAKEAQRMHLSPFLTMPADRSGDVYEPPALSQDALLVQTITADLERAGVRGDLFGIVQRHGYLSDWEQDRWLKGSRPKRNSHKPGCSKPVSGIKQWR